MRIAYLEDDPDQAALIRRWLEGAGHGCHYFGRGRELIRSLARQSFDLYLLDWHLPDIDGLEVLKAMRARASDAPVIFTTLRDRDDDIARVLQAGADDYIAKPVRRGELLARIEAVTRRLRGRHEGGERLELPPFVVDRQSRRIQRDGRPIALTDKEYELAAFLFLNLGKIVSRSHLLESVWGRGREAASRTVDTHISRLRTKLGLNATPGWKLSAVHQMGYRLERAAPRTPPDKTTGRVNSM